MKGLVKIVVWTAVEIGLVITSGYAGAKVGQGILEVVKR